MVSQYPWFSLNPWMILLFWPTIPLILKFLLTVLIGLLHLILLPMIHLLTLMVLRPIRLTLEFFC